MSEEGIDEVMQKVKDWLVEEGIYKDKMTDENANYHFIAEFPTDSRQLVDIIQPKAREDLVVIASGVGLTEEHYKALKSMPRPKRDELLWDLRFQLLFRDSDFQMIPSADDLQKIQFARPIHFDGLTKDKLMEVMRENFKCRLFIIWKMKQLFGEAPPSSPAPMYG